MYAGSNYEQALINAISKVSDAIGYMEGIRTRVDGDNPLHSRELSLAITYTEDALLRLGQLHGRLRGEDK